MKAINVRWFGMLTLAALPLYSGYSQNPPPPAAPPPAASAPNTPPVLTIPKPSEEKAEVLKLSKAGMGEDVILAYVKNARTSFNLSAGDILHLKDEGVSAPVITAMLTHDHALRNQAPNQPPPQFSGNQPPPPLEGQPLPPPTDAPAAAAQNQIMTPPLVPTGAPDGAVPPPAQVEVVPVAPGADYYWAPGYWGWNGGWIWIGGGWYPHGYYGWGWRGGGWGGWGRGGGGGHSSGGWGRSNGGGHSSGGGRGH